MAVLADYVTITITRNLVGTTSPGFGIPMFLGYTATWTDRIRYYANTSAMVTDGFTTDSAEYLAASAAFAQSPRPVQVAIGRGANKPTQQYVIGVQSAAVGNTYTISVAGKGITAGTATFTTLADLSGTLLPRTSNTLTLTAHGMNTGDGPYYVSNSGGALPGGLTANTPYWIINITANTFQFASSKANAIALTPVTLSSDGTGTQTILRSENDVIMAQLLQGLNAITGAGAYGVVQSGSAGSQILTITGAAAGNWFSLAINDPSLLTNKQSHADPGVVADLTAIALQNGTWYGLATLYNSQAYVVAAAGWVQSNNRIYLPDVQDTLAVTTSGGSGGSADTIDALHTLADSRVMAAYHPSPAGMLAPAWLGRMLPLDPGSATWKFKTLATVPVVNLTENQRANLRTRQGNSYEPVAGLNITFEGTCSDGEFLDAIVGDDWVANDMQVRVFNAEANGLKVEYEDSGIRRIGAAVEATLKEAVRRKIYAAGSIQITLPSITSVPATDKQTRTLNNVLWSAVRSGAIHITNVQGTVSLS